MMEPRSGSFTNLFPLPDEYQGEDELKRNAGSQASIAPSESTTSTTTTSSELEPSQRASQLFKKKFEFFYQQIPRDILTREMIQFGISFIGPAIGTAQFAYLKLEVRNKNIKNIDLLSGYPHLRLVDLTDNLISNLEPMSSMKYLQVLNVGGNQIKSLYDIPHFQWLQALNASRNELTTLDGFEPNHISYMNLSGNKITSIEYLTGEIFPNLLLLELRGNLITSIAEIELPKLRHLYIAENMLTNLNGIQNCPSLELIHARDNKISSLEDFPALDKLKYVNLRKNRLSKFTQTKNLGNAPNLEILVLSQNKIAASNRYRTETCAAILSLKRLDKFPVSEMELVQGRLFRTGRIKDLVDQLEDDETLISPIESQTLEYDGENE